MEEPLIDGVTTVLVMLGAIKMAVAAVQMVAMEEASLIHTVKILRAEIMVAAMVALCLLVLMLLFTAQAAAVVLIILIQRMLAVLAIKASLIY